MISEQLDCIKAVIQCHIKIIEAVKTLMELFEIRQNY